MKLGISITTFTTDPPRERTTNKQTNKQKRKGIEKHVKIGWWASWQQALGTEMNWLRKFASYAWLYKFAFPCMCENLYLYLTSSLLNVDIVLCSNRHCQRMCLEIVHLSLSLSLSRKRSPYKNSCTST